MVLQLPRNYIYPCGMRWQIAILPQCGARFAAMHREVFLLDMRKEYGHAKNTDFFGFDGGTLFRGDWPSGGLSGVL